MSKRNKNTTTRRSALTLAMKAALFASIIAMGNAHALVFHDPGHTFQNIMTQLRDMAANVKQWGVEYKQWVQTYQHYMQQLADAQKMFNPQSFMGGGFDIQKRDLNHGMEDCGPGSSFSPAELLKNFSVDPDGNIVEQQATVCRKIAYAENLRYNEGVDIFLKLKKQDQDLQLMAGYRSGATGEGKMLTSNNDLMLFTAVSAAELEYSQNKIAAYGSVITSLEREQQRLGQIALNGKKPTFGQQVLGSVVQGAILKGALEGLK